MVMTAGSVEHQGRQVAYTAYGPASGTPVLFIPGAGCGRRMAFGLDRLADQEVRLISVDRPGLGASDPDPDKTLDSVAADLAALIDVAVGHAVPVVANSQGAPFGLALAGTGRVSVLMLVSPIDDLGHPAMTARLPEPHREFVTGIADDPNAAMQELSGYTAAKLFDMVMADYPASDRAVYDEPGFRTMLRTALADGFAPGPAGYARDAVLATTAWPSSLLDPGVPVSLFFGGDDHVHSPDQGATLTTRIRGATRAVVTGVGGSLLWARPELVFGAIRAIDR